MNASNSLFDLRGRVALVTGGAGNLGLAMGVALAQSGATVYLGSRDVARAQEAASQAASDSMPGSLHGIALDPNNPESIAAAMDSIEEIHGPLNILVNAAGGNVPAATVLPGASFSAVSPEAMQSVWNCNVMAGAVLPTQALLARVEKAPRATSMIMVGSVSSTAALTRIAGYGMAKAAVENLTRWLAVHVARDLKLPIRVNAIVPGFFLTEQNRYLLRTEDGLTARGETILRQTPMGRFGEAAELGGVAVWLASDASSFVTGATIDVDGGFMAWAGV